MKNICYKLSNLFVISIFTLLLVSLILFAQSSVAFAEEFPTPDEVSESQKKDVMCALILDSDDKKLSEHVFCDPRHKGLVCNYGINFPKKVCNSPDKVWYQKSIDEAAQIYSRNSNIKPKIKLSAGTMKIQYLFSAHWPYGDYIGIHLKEGVGLEGHSYGKYNSYIRLTPFKLKSFASNKVVSSSDKIRALILVAKNKIYQNPNETVLTETSNNSIKNIYLSGHSGGDIGCRDINDEEVRVGSAIFAAGVTDLKLYNINAFHFTGNIFEIGAFLPWVKEDSACNGIECIGKRMWVKGRDSSHPVTIKNNKLCDGNFGGIVLVGENIELENNEIKFIKKTWDINKSGYGLTMGISASFAGTQNIKIVNNDIEGGDYGIGSDGSFPLAVTVQLFNEYSEQIVNALGQETMLKYPNGIATQDRILLEGLDFVRGQQVLFNIASKNAVDKNIETGFGSNIFLSYNKVKDAVTGISLYRMKNSVIGNNKIESNDKGFVGIGIYDTYDTALYLNSINNWNKGVHITGVPQQRSRLGSSYVGVGAIPPKYSKTGKWESVGNDFNNNYWSVAIENAGYNIAVRSNRIKDTDGKGNCLYKNIKNTAPGMDWTTGNNKKSCDN